MSIHCCYSNLPIETYLILIVAESGDDKNGVPDRPLLATGVPAHKTPLGTNLESQSIGPAGPRLVLLDTIAS